MILAEALAIRKDTQKKIELLQIRLLNNVRVQEGSQPAENPDELRKDIEANLTALSKLIFAINKTNMLTLSNGQTLTQMLAQREVLDLRLQLLRALFDKATAAPEGETRLVTTIDVKELMRDMDWYAKQLRQLDLKIDELNFSTELIS